VVQSTRRWLLLRDWVRALQAFVRHVVMLAAFAVKLAPEQEHARRARAAAS
jgi:hypothetical protein